jgi:hypothetical protein
VCVCVCVCACVYVRVCVSVNCVRFANKSKCDPHRVRDLEIALARDLVTLVLDEIDQLRDGRGGHAVRQKLCTECRAIEVPERTACEEQVRW